MWKKIGAWFQLNCWWIKWLGIVLALAVGYMVAARFMAKLTQRVREPITWKALPGIEGSVAVLNPATGRLDIVALPDGVVASKVKSVGISETRGTYEVEIKHVPTARRAAGDIAAGG